MRFLIMIMISIGCIFGGNLPKGYDTYKDVLYQEIDTVFPEFFIPPYFGGLIEHESCISLTHSKCWNPKSELNTKREYAIGFGQITKAYNKDGIAKEAASTAAASAGQAATNAGNAYTASVPPQSEMDFQAA